MSEKKKTLVEFTVDLLSNFKFRSEEEVGCAIIQSQTAVQYCCYTGEVVIINSIPDLAKEVYEKLPTENKEV